MNYHGVHTQVIICMVGLCTGSNLCEFYYSGKLAIRAFDYLNNKVIVQLILLKSVCFLGVYKQSSEYKSMDV